MCKILLGLLRRKTEGNHGVEAILLYSSLITIVTDSLITISTVLFLFCSFDDDNIQNIQSKIGSKQNVQCNQVLDIVNMYNDQC